LEELKQDITVLTETKEKKCSRNTRTLHFYSGAPKEKRAKRRVPILVKKEIQEIYCDLGGSKRKYDKVIYEFI